MKTLLCMIAVALAASLPARADYAEIHGLKMYYEIHGQGRPVVLLHGGTANIEYSFARQIPELAKEHRVIAIEQIGHGHTADDPKREISYESMAEDTAALLEKLGIANADFVGWSDGGQLALRLAFTHPKLVRKVIASGVALGPEGAEPEAMKWFANVKPEEFEPHIRQLYEKVSPDGPAHWPVFFERLRKMFLRPSWGLSEAEVRTIKAPTMIVAGDHDFILPEHEVKLFRLIPDAQLCILPGTGHGTFPRRPEWLNPIALSFLDAPMPEAKK
jgi:pimeloyl-ACP methyl ester carboxylesterase